MAGAAREEIDREGAAFESAGSVGAAGDAGKGARLTWKTGPGLVDAAESGGRKASRSSQPAMTCRATQSNRQRNGRSINSSTS
ncbi:hypothetical protein [Pseudomonas mangiferae]|uniref:hypothetical protein n=1 Tax=Pseudomonas mangiferae TaxID=2593654 RepID=UPI0015B4C006|nr:hypothetical protein [Pseudomonas mangiferae]